MTSLLAFILGLDPPGRVERMREDLRRLTERLRSSEAELERVRQRLRAAGYDGLVETMVQAALEDAERGMP